MFGLPEWAVGVGADLVSVTALQVVYVRLMPAEYRRRRSKREPLRAPEDIERRLAELDDVTQRPGELEERVDLPSAFSPDSAMPCRWVRPDDRPCEPLAA
ncbi:MAG TPA: hypothetical protein VMG41_15470 [Gemmatimonadales bacterium]|nr:hypothetical protein [Gemmatimonadales bacterium]